MRLVRFFSIFYYNSVLYVAFWILSLQSRLRIYFYQNCPSAFQDTLCKSLRFNAEVSIRWDTLSRWWLRLIIKKKITSRMLHYPIYIFKNRFICQKVHLVFLYLRWQILVTIHQVINLCLSRDACLDLRIR